MSRLIPPALVLAGLLVFWMTGIGAAGTGGDGKDRLNVGETPSRSSPLPVAALVVSERSVYRVERVYGGRVHRRRTSDLGFEVSGVVASIVVAEGDAVEAGQVLARLDRRALSAERRAARASLAVAEADRRAQRAQLALARSSLERYGELMASGHGSEQRHDELASQVRVGEARLALLLARVQRAAAGLELIEVGLAKLAIVAPYDGIVQRRALDEGSVIGPGQPLLTVVEAGALEARIGIPQQLLDHLHGARTYPFEINGRTVQGELVNTLPVANDETGTVTAIFHVPAGDYVAGALAELVLSVEVPAAGFWLPLTALSESERGLWSVLTIGPDEIVEPHLVEILYRGRDRVFVTGSIGDGDIIVSSGTSRIVPGQRVRVARLSDPLALPG